MGILNFYDLRVKESKETLVLYSYTGLEVEVYVVGSEDLYVSSFRIRLRKDHFHGPHW